ncbi:MAG: NCS2 family permease [Clostridium sp.]
MEVNKKKSFLDTFFKLSEHGTSVKTELLAGITTFVTVAYIIFVNPSILRMAGINEQGLLGDAVVQAGLNVGNDKYVAALFAATCLAAAIGSILMGLLSNLPFVLAPGMGINAFFTFGIVLTLGFTWQQALASVFISGIAFLIITMTPLLDIIVKALPQNLKLAITGGIGLFIALIGLKSGGIIVANPDTLVGFGDFRSAAVLLTIFGILLTATLMALNVKASMLIAIVATTLVGIPMGITNTTDVSFISAPPSVSPLLFEMDFVGLVKSEAGVGAAVLSFVMVFITITLVVLFDTLGAMLGTASKAGLVNEDGSVKNMKGAMLAMSLGTIAGAALGTSSLNCCVESTSGISQGGRTGLTSVFAGLLFIAALFFSGLVGIVPPQATAPALVIVGVLMLSAVSGIDFDDFTEAVPVFFTIAIMPFSYSIANGVAMGLILYPFMKLVSGRYKEVHPIVYVLAVAFVLRFALL